MDRAAYWSSGILHIVLILLFVAGLPNFLEKRPLADDYVITVELLPISAFTNIKIKKKVVEPEVKEKEIEPLTESKPKEALPEPSEVQVEPVTTKVVKKEIEVKPEEIEEKKETVVIKPIKKKKKKPKKKVKSDFASVLKTVEKIKAKERAEEVDLVDIEDGLEVTTTKKYKPGLPLSFSEKDAIRQQIVENWTVLAGAKDAANMVVELRISMAPDGKVLDVIILDKFRYKKDPFFKAMVDSAVRAVYKSSPFEGLPKEKYDTRDGWRDLELSFDPSKMFY